MTKDAPIDAETFIPVNYQLIQYSQYYDSHQETCSLFQ